VLASVATKVAPFPNHKPHEDRLFPTNCLFRHRPPQNLIRRHFFQLCSHRRAQISNHHRLPSCPCCLHGTHPQPDFSLPDFSFYRLWTGCTGCYDLLFLCVPSHFLTLASVDHAVILAEPLLF
jgi:hypothetical protein